MAAAAFLRSVARKIAPAPYPRPFLARGLYGGVPSASEPGASTELGSLASKMARAPPLPHQRLLLHERGLHSRASPNSASTPPPTAGKKDLRAALAEVKTGLSYIGYFCAFICLYSWIIREAKKPRAKMDSLYGELSELKDTMQAIRHEYQNMNARVQNILALARSMQHSGHGEETDGATDKRRRVHNLEEAAKLHRIKELEDVINHLQSENTELKVALESTRSEGGL